MNTTITEITTTVQPVPVQVSQTSVGSWLARTCTTTVVSLAATIGAGVGRYSGSGYVVRVGSDILYSFSYNQAMQLGRISRLLASTTANGTVGLWLPALTYAGAGAGGFVGGAIATGLSYGAIKALEYTAVKVYTLVTLVNPANSVVNPANSVEVASVMPAEAEAHKSEVPNLIAAEAKETEDRDTNNNMRKEGQSMDIYHLD